MKALSSSLRVGAYVIASAFLGAGITASDSRAAIIDLGFALDASGSVGGTNFNTARTALASALGAIPTSGPNTYRVSVVTFASGASTVHTAVIDSPTALSGLQTAVGAAVYTGGTTCVSCATQLLTNNINALGSFGDLSLINITTDGEPNGGNEDGTSLRGLTVAAGWDSISAEAVGGFSLSFLEDLVYPNPGLTTNDPNGLPNPLTQGFIITVANFDAYSAAISAKVQRVVDPGQTPIPGALPLFVSGLGAMGLVAWRRKKKAQAAA